jgi:hypothetical protein
LQEKINFDVKLITFGQGDGIFMPTGKKGGKTTAVQADLF